MNRLERENKPLHEKSVRLKTADGFELSAYSVESSNPTAGLVILQEIFGVTLNLKSIASQYALNGFRVLVPSLFDRVQPNALIPYNEVEQGKSLAAQCSQDLVLADIEAAVNAARVDGKATVVGYCWGGTYAYLAACKLTISSAVSFYGGGVKQALNELPNCPIQFHFGALDPMITGVDVAEIKLANPLQPLLFMSKQGMALQMINEAAFTRVALI